MFTENLHESMVRGTLSLSGYQKKVGFLPAFAADGGPL